MKLFHTLVVAIFMPCLTQGMNNRLPGILRQRLGITYAPPVDTTPEVVTAREEKPTLDPRSSKNSPDYMPVEPTPDPGISDNSPDYMLLPEPTEEPGTADHH
ncbi:hypothetical protein HDE_09149 [Halotydeus destructor]|nr:hypothetical protein HDE_09149 [Halotydeus destructor]